MYGKSLVLTHAHTHPTQYTDIKSASLLHTHVCTQQVWRLLTQLSITCAQHFLYLCFITGGCLLTNSCRYMCLSRFITAFKAAGRLYLTVAWNKVLCKSSHHDVWPPLHPPPHFLTADRRSRGAPSSPSSTCPSTPAVCCPPSSPPSSEVGAGSMWLKNTHQHKNSQYIKLACVCVCVWFSAQECGIHSQQKCYPLAFGVPAALMVVALSKNLVFKHLYAAHVIANMYLNTVIHWFVTWAKC